MLYKHHTVVYNIHCDLKTSTYDGPILKIISSFHVLVGIHILTCFSNIFLDQFTQLLEQVLKQMK